MERDQHLEDGLAHGIEAVSSLSYTLQQAGTFDASTDRSDTIADVLYTLNEITETFEELKRIVETQRFKVRVGDMFVVSCTIDSSPVIAFGTLGEVFAHDEAKRIATIVTRYMQQTATLQRFGDS